jgi:hypothetical protein
MLLVVGSLAWASVALFSIAVAEWDEPVWGYFLILAAVLAAWAVGEVVSRRWLEEERP